MARTTAKEKKYNKEYYKKHKEKIISKNIKRHKANKPKYAKESREYYADNPDYRRYKKNYAKRYRKENYTKSLARKDRKPVKKR